jgi:hypothetical protein
MSPKPPPACEEALELVVAVSTGDVMLVAEEVVETG